MFNLKFTKEALFDIEEIIFWYEDKRVGLSHDFELCLEIGLAEITRNPQLIQNRYKSVKIRFINRFPFGIHYIKKEKNIIILVVFHTSRSPKSWKNRKF
jgi:toxin ParE1/3/4